MSAENQPGSELDQLEPLQSIKVQLITEGLGIDEQLLADLEKEGEAPLTLADYASTSGITLRLGDDVWVNAPIKKYNPNFVDNPSNVLRLDEDRIFVVNEEASYAAELLPVPHYHDQALQDGSPVTWIAVTHSDRVRLSPIKGCALECDFCDIPFEDVLEGQKYHGRKKIDNILEAAGVAIADTVLPAQHILISGGTPRSIDYGYENEVYERVIEENPGIEVDIMMVPLKGLLKVRHLKSIGVSGLSINMEVWDSDVAKATMHNKIKSSRDRYLEFIEEAVEEFGPGNVRSLLLVGLEDIEDTLKGVRALAEIGCDPVLSPFRPDPITPLGRMRPPSEGELVDVWQRSLEIVGGFDEVKLGPRCIPCMHNTLTFPDNSGAYYHSSQDKKREYKQ